MMSTDDQMQQQAQQRKPLTGARLRAYAFAVLTRKEYSKAELINKLAQYAENMDEVQALVEEFAQYNYQSDQRVATTLLSSQIRKGKGPIRIKQALKNKQVDQQLIADEIDDIDWTEQAYQLKVKKFGPDVATDAKIKAKQIRFLQYRGFDLDVIFKAISRTAD